MPSVAKMVTRNEMKRKSLGEEAVKQKKMKIIEEKVPDSPKQKPIKKAKDVEKVPDSPKQKPIKKAKDVEPAKNVKKAKDVEPAKNVKAKIVEPAKNVKAKNVEPAENMKKAKNAEPAKNVKKAKNVEPAENVKKANVEPAKNGKAAKKVEPAKNEKAAKNVKPAKNEKAAKNVKPAKNEKAAKNVKPAKNEKAAKNVKPAKNEKAAKNVKPAKKKAKFADKNWSDVKEKLEGHDLKIFMDRLAEISARSIQIWSKKDGLKKIVDSINSSVSVRKGKRGKTRLICKSKKAAIEKCKVLKKFEDLKVTLIPKAWYQDYTYRVNPFVLYVQNLPQTATQVELEKAFPKAEKVTGFGRRRNPCLVYKEKETAMKDFHSNSVEIHRTKIILTFYITERKPVGEEKKKEQKTVKEEEEEDMDEEEEENDGEDGEEEDEEDDDDEEGEDDDDEEEEDEDTDD